MRLSTGERIQQGPTLSLAMIVKNEAEHLEKCLSTARPHVDEIVIVDTGSTDGTQEIAQRYADVFEEIEWPDSFSVARNHSFDLASGDYIMWLDGDEHIDDDEQWRKLREVLREEESIAGIQFMIHNLVPENQVLEADVMPQVRLVKNHPVIRFEGKVHNQIGDNLARYRKQSGDTLGRAAVKVIHVGYALSRDEINAKYSERLHLLEHEVEHAPTASRKAYYQYQLGNGLFMLKKYERATAVFEETDYSKLASANAYYTRFMHGFAYLQTDRPEEALEQANHMLSLTEREPIGYVLAGQALNELERQKEALLMLIEAYERRDGERNIRFALDKAYLKRMIASLCAKVGDLKRAKIFIEEYLDKYPDDESGREFLNVITKKMESLEIPAT
ncbi:MAG: glycosyltransferase [Bacteroidetes bacterium]|jgi:glycosyltransferase involved in cell wall biosynthesis|nr:glycosyltransferase [Bacteroidota bacterium]